MWKIALGVALGIVFAGIIASVAEYFFAVALISEATKALDKVFSTTPTQQLNDPMNSLRVVPISTAYQSPIPKTKEQIIHENSAHAVMSIRKDVEDFRAQYKKPEECYDIKNNATRIDCANHYIRARKAYEAQIAQKQ